MPQFNEDRSSIISADKQMIKSNDSLGKLFLELLSLLKKKIKYEKFKRCMCLIQNQFGVSDKCSVKLNADVDHIIQTVRVKYKEIR